MRFTLEALYALHMFNDSSNDLFLLPLPMEAEETRLESLRRTLLKGYEDLKELGLIVNDEPTQECADYGLLLDLFSKALFHVQVDNNYFCALEVEPDKSFSVVIEKTEEGDYVLERLNTAVFLAILRINHTILHDLDEKKKNYALSDWIPYSKVRLMAYYSQKEAIRLVSYRAYQMQQDRLFLDLQSGLFEYDVRGEQIRSIENEVLKDYLLQRLKVRL